MTASYGRGFIDISPQATGLSGFQSSLAGAMGGIAKSAAAVFTVAFAAAVGVGIKGVGAFAELEKGMNEVFTLLPGISQGAMDQMTGQVRDLSKEFGVMTGEVVPALYQAISAGVDEDNVFDFLDQAVRASIAGVTDLDTAVDGLTTILNAWGLEAAQVGDVSDAMFTAVRLGKTTMDELSRSIADVAPIASELGIGFGEVLAPVATLAKAGVPTSQAANSIRAALVAMMRPTADMANAFDALGFESGRAMIEALGFQGAIEALREHADATGVEMVTLTGRVEGANAILNLTGPNAATANEHLAEMADRAGATDVAYERMDQGLSRTWDKIKAQFADAFIEIGSRLAPHVQQFSEWFADRLPGIVDNLTIWFAHKFLPAVRTAFDWFKTNAVPVIRDQVIPAIRQLVDVIRGVVQIAGPILGKVIGWLSTNILPGLVKMVKAVIGWMVDNKGIVAAIGAVIVAFKLMTVIMAINPFTLIIAAVIALTALIISNWDKITAFLRRIWNWITKAVGAVGQAISTAFRTAVEFVRRLFLNFTPLGLIIKHFDTIKRVATGVKDWIVAQFTALVSFFAGMPRRIANAIRGLWDGIKDTFRSAINWVIQKWNNLKIEMRIPAGIPLIGGSGFTINTPNIPLFHEGGIVPGPAGSEMLAILKAGERVLSRAEVAAEAAGSGFSPTFILQGTPQDLVRQVGNEVSWALGK